MNKPLNLNSTYCKILNQLITDGARVSARGKPTRETLGSILRIDNPLENVIQVPERKLNYHFMVAEALWMLMGREDVAMPTHYNKNIAQFSDDGVTFDGAYGPRILAQLPRILDTLSSDPSSRQAVISIWDRMPTPGTHDVPCTTMMQFFIREEGLHMFVTMRSSDAWLGLPYDIFNFTTIQNAVAGELRVKLGRFMLFMASSHLYEEHVDAAMSVIAHTNPKQWGGYVSPLLSGLPPLLDVAELSARDGRYQPNLPQPWKNYINVLAHKTNKSDALLNDNPFGQMLLEMKEKRHATNP